MRPDERDFEEEIRAHISLSIQERVARGETPEAARLAALGEFGHVPHVRDRMRRVWYSRSFDAVAALEQDIRVALRSLSRGKGVAALVVVTLALGIGPTAAMLSLLREHLVGSWLDRHHDRVIYLQQSAPGRRAGNIAFSLPEAEDFHARITTLEGLATFSNIELPMIGFGERRVVHASVVSSEYFEVLRLRPVLGRVLVAADDAPEAEPAAVLTHRFWTAVLDNDPAVIGRTIRLGPRVATVVGVLERRVPSPSDPEIIVNPATSPRHQAAAAVKVRTRRMAELVGRLAPDATLEAARTELMDVHAAMVREHPAAYSAQPDMQLDVRPLREQIGGDARRGLFVLLALSGVIVAIACSNIATLFLTRAAPDATEFAVRAALGASPAALRRTLFARSLVLCGAGAILGVPLAHWIIEMIGRYDTAFSARAHGGTLSAEVVWTGAALALAAAVLLASIPRLPSAVLRRRPELRPVAAGANRRLRAIAIAQIAFCFVLLVAAGMLVTALVDLQTARTGYNMRQVLALDVRSSSHDGATPEDLDFYTELERRVRELPGVRGVAFGTFVPWRDAGTHGGGVRFAAEGHTAEEPARYLHARLRGVSPGFFDVLGVPVLAGREFSEHDRRDSERVALVSESAARRLFPNGNALDGTLRRIDPYWGPSPPLRIVGVVADVDDESLEGDAALTIYGPVEQLSVGGRLFVHAAGDPYALVPSLTRIIVETSAERLADGAATLDDVRAEVLAPDRFQALVLSVFAAIALLVVAVGLGGVLACSVSARKRELAVRLAIGATAGRLLLRVLSEGAAIVAPGIALGAAASYACAGLAAMYLQDVQLPGMVPLLWAGAILSSVAMAASLLPAWRASRLDVLDALRPE